MEIKLKKTLYFYWRYIINQKDLNKIIRNVYHDGHYKDHINKCRINTLCYVKIDKSDALLIGEARKCKEDNHNKNYARMLSLKRAIDVLILSDIIAKEDIDTIMNYYKIKHNG